MQLFPPKYSILIILAFSLFYIPSVSVLAQSTDTEQNIKDIQTYIAGARFGCAYDITQKHPDYPDIPQETLKQINDDCGCMINTTVELHGTKRIADIFEDKELFSKIVTICKKKGYLQHLK